MRTGDSPSGQWHEGIDLLYQVHSCDFCRDLGFTRPRPEKPFFKFPPSIGATDRATLLFVEIAPLLTHGSEELLRAIANDVRAFEALSRNRVGGERYICRPGGEPYYHDHMFVVQGLFGSEAHFEKYAAVTQLFLCAAENTHVLPCENSPCANAYFEMVFEHLRPEFVICVGDKVESYFQKQFKFRNRKKSSIRLGEHEARVLSIAHPRSPGMGTLQRRELLRPVIAEIKKTLLSRRKLQFKLGFRPEIRR